MNFIFKILSFFKNTKYKYVVIFVGIIAVVFIFNKEKTSERTLDIVRGDFVNQISVSGKVVASKDVDLGFKNAGRVESIYYSVGNTVKSGSLITKIDATDAEKDVDDALVNLETSKLDLEKIRVANSNINLNADLQKSYDDGFNEMADTFLDSQSIISGLDDLFAEDSLSDQDAQISGNKAVSFRDQAEDLYYKSEKTFEKSRINFRNIDRSSPKEEIEIVINETYEMSKVLADAIKSTRNFVDYLSEDLDDSYTFTSFQDDLSDYTTENNLHLSNLISIQNSIKKYKDAFLNTDLDIKDSLLLIQQRENALEDARKKLEDYYIRAPFDGIVTTIDAKVGEITSPNTPLISIMSNDLFQIESYVPEVNIAQIKLGDKSVVTLDAYGDSVFFNGGVVFIDPAETVRDGVSTYKVTLQFDTQDPRIKSGMTANIIITTEQKNGVISIPQGIVMSKDGKKFVVKKIGSKTEEVEVSTGSVSSLGNIEITSGLMDGDIVVLPSLK